MHDVGGGVALERFELVAEGQVYAVVDIVEQQAATLTLTALSEFPLQLPADTARQFVEAWRQRANVGSQPYEVRQQQREV